MQPQHVSNTNLHRVPFSGLTRVRMEAWWWWRETNPSRVWRRCTVGPVEGTMT